MNLRNLCNLLAISTIVIFSYGAAGAQVVDAVKDAAGKTKEITVDTTKKAAEATKKTLDKTTDKTAEATKKTGSAAKNAGGYTVKVVDNVKGQSYEGGKWLTVTTWNGTKWVSKRTWIETKKATRATKDAVVGDSDKQP